MDPPPFKFPASPGTPLFPLSPERVNGTRPLYGLPQSPSLPDFSKPTDFAKPIEFTLNPSTPSLYKSSGHSRTTSDAHVQGMVARFNSLDIKDHKDARRVHEVDFKREQMARELAENERDRAKKAKEVADSKLKELREAANKAKEEAEAEIAKLREQTRRLKAEAGENKAREEKVSRRLGAVMEDFVACKEERAMAKAAYEKELRRARKDGYTADSERVKLREQLKDTVKCLKVARSELEDEKAKVSRREQEAFTAKYQLIDVQAELDRMREKAKVVEEEWEVLLTRIKVAEDERDVLLTSLKEEELARIAAEGRIPLPTSIEDEDDEFASPVKSPKRQQKRDSSDKENLLPMPIVETQVLQEELELERRRRERAEEQVVFMKMECQFGCCSCRIAEDCGVLYVHDDSFAAEMEKIKVSIPQPITPPASEPEDQQMQDELLDQPVELKEEGSSAPAEPIRDTEQQIDALISFSPTSGTFHSVAPIPTSMEKEDQLEEPQPLDGDVSEDAPLCLQASVLYATAVKREPRRSSLHKPLPENEENDDPQTPLALLAPHYHLHTPLHREIRTVTTTTTIPITFSPFAEPGATKPATPSTIAHVPTRPDQTFSSKPNGEFDREAALEQIRLRRGRARSVAMGHATPRKAMIERRDISAPNARGCWTVGG